MVKSGNVVIVFLLVLSLFGAVLLLDKTEPNVNVDGLTARVQRLEQQNEALQGIYINLVDRVGSHERAISILNGELVQAESPERTLPVPAEAKHVE
jgi:hypothetical protein